MTEPEVESIEYTDDLHKQLWDQYFCEAVSPDDYTQALLKIRTYSAQYISRYIRLVQRQIRGHKYRVIRRKTPHPSPIVSEWPYLDVQTIYEWDEIDDWGFGGLDILAKLRHHTEKKYDAGLDAEIEFVKKLQLILTFRGRKQDPDAGGLSANAQERFVEFVSRYANIGEIIDATIKFVIAINFDGNGDKRIRFLIYDRRPIAELLMKDDYDPRAVEIYTQFAGTVVRLGVPKMQVPCLVATIYPTGLRLRPESAEKLHNLVAVYKTHKS